MYRTQRHVCEIQYTEIKVPKWHYVVLLTFESIMFPKYIATFISFVFLFSSRSLDGQSKFSYVMRLQNHILRLLRVRI